MKVLVFGSINVDHVAYVKSLPLAGETISGEYNIFPGGKGCNQAVASKRSGSETLMLGAVGHDEASSYMMRFMEAEGINTEFVEKSDNPTGVALIFVDANSENSIAVCSGANLDATPPMNTSALIAEGDVVLAQGETRPKSVESIFQQAKKCGATTILNPAPYFAINDSLLKDTDVIVFNEIEYSQFIGADQTLSFDEISHKIRNHTNHIIIVTMGKDGVLYSNKGIFASLDAVDVTAIDTTGAGDCFCGYLASALSQRVSVDKAVRLANLAAAISVTRKGAAASIPRKGELKIG